jgi:hypothetical protein
LIGRVPGTVLAWGLAWLVGYFLIACLWRNRSRDAADRLLHLAAAWGLGSGLVAVLTFLWIVVIGKLSRGIVVVDLAVLVMLFFGCRLTREPSTTVGDPPCLLGWAASSIFLFFTAIALAIIGTILLRIPDGAWDGVAIWSTHAKFFLASSPNGWKAMFDPMTTSHPDYPFLVPTLIAHGWFYAGQSIPLVQMTLAFMFSFALLVLITSAVAKSRGALLGALACAVLATSPIFLGTASSEYADLPLAFFFLLSVALLHRADQEQEICAGLHVLAGLAAGMGALTKNEGSMFAIALGMGRLFHLLLTGKTWRELKSLAYILLGMAPILGTLFLYKTFTPANYLISGQGKDFWSKLLSPSRARLILDELLILLEQPHGFSDLLVQRIRAWHWHLLASSAFILLFGLDRCRLARRLSTWGIVVVVLAILADILGTRLATQAFGWHWPVVVGAAFAIVGLGFDLKRLMHPSFLAIIATFVLVNVGYFLVYMLTPLDLKWQLTYSIERIVFHTMPIAIFVAFLAMVPRENGLVCRDTNRPVG